MKSDQPLVCICVPTYNAAPTVHETLASILAQTYRNITIQVSDNASTDNTPQVVESLGDARITLHRQTQNIGAEGNFTHCIQLATGKYTAIFHADDLYEPDIVAKQVAYLEAHPEVGAVFTAAITIDEHGEILGQIGDVPHSQQAVTILTLRELLQHMLLNHNFLVCPSVMVRTEIYQNEIREWGSHLFKSSSDIDTWLRLAHSRPIAVLNEPLMRYRISHAQFSEKIRNRTERADFFLVMDHYLAKPEIIDLLTTEDFQHYRWLERHERVARAINLFGLGRASEAKSLLAGLFCWDAISAAMQTRRGLVTFAGGMLLRCLMWLGLANKGDLIVKTIKKISWR